PGSATGRRSRTTRPAPGARTRPTSSSTATGGHGVGIERLRVDRSLQTEPRAKPATPDVGTASGASVASTLSAVRRVAREITSLRVAPGSDGPYQRTSVMTHMAWVPEEWLSAAEEVLDALAERHPSRTLALIPHPDEEDGLEASVQVMCFPVGEG